MSQWPFGKLPMFGYDLIVADPPWDFENWSEKGEAKNAKAHYDCVPLEDIMALPVGQLAARPCVLFLWITNPLIFKAEKVLEAWDFRYAGLLTWNKKTKHGKPAFGTGYNFRCSTEQIAVGFMGSPVHVKNQRTGFDGIVGRDHSEKPEEAMLIAERYLTAPKKPKLLELFSRTSRKGWDSAGLEAGKFGGTQGPDDLVLKLDFWPYLNTPDTPTDDLQSEMFDADEREVA